MKPLWYKNAIIYGIDVKAFQDSNGDGVGDFPGLTGRLDYLAELGITCLWLLPFYQSPNRDNGYDITDFYSIHPNLGTLDDFRMFLQEAHRRGIKVLVDLVIHHTSSEHPWFKAAQSSPFSPFRDYYVWRDKMPKRPHPNNVFPDYETDTWKYDKLANAWYFYQFYHFQPDLNLANKEVQKEMLKVAEFWASLGVNGFRIDASGLIFHYQGQGYPASIPKVPGHYLKEIRRIVQKYDPENVVLGETDTEPEAMKVFFGEEDRMHLMLNFLMNQALFAALAMESFLPIQDILRRIPTIPFRTQWVNFIRNLDELNIDKLPKNQQKAIMGVFGKDPNTHLYHRGLRRRVAPMLQSEERLKSLFALMFALPGTPLICYGDEIGMGEDLCLPERVSVRTPMQWSSEKNAGFSTAKTADLFLPVISKGTFSYKKINVRAAKKRTTSVYSLVKDLIALRKGMPILGECQPEIMVTSDEQVLALHYDMKGEHLVTLFNLCGTSKTISCERDIIKKFQLKEMLSDRDYSVRDSFADVQLGAYGYRWFSTLKKKR